jgi:hypothetical protein
MTWVACAYDLGCAEQALAQIPSHLPMTALNYAQPPQKHMGVTLVVCHLLDMHCIAMH